MTYVIRYLLASRESDECVVPTEPLGPDGRIIVTHSGLRIALHRLVWMLDGRELGSNLFLLRTCATFGCVSPKHHFLSRTAWPPRTSCPNGHVYTPEDATETGWRCHVCRENRLARRRRGGKQNWELQLERQFCPSGHEYTPDNIYWENTPRGRKRHCKTCVRARRAGLDPADVIAA